VFPARAAGELYAERVQRVVAAHADAWNAEERVATLPDALFADACGFEAQLPDELDDGGVVIVRGKRERADVTLRPLHEQIA